MLGQTVEHLWRKLKCKLSIPQLSTGLFSSPPPTPSHATKKNTPRFFLRSVHHLPSVGFTVATEPVDSPCQSLASPTSSPVSSRSRRHTCRPLRSTPTPPHLPTPAQHTHPCARPQRRRRRPRSGSSAPAAATEAPEAVVGAGGARWEPMGTREYYEYRRAIYGDITHKAILVDAAGTLLAPTEPMAQVYRTVGDKYGVKYSEDDILMRTSRPRRAPPNKTLTGALP
nr:uncharacterized protein LOC109758739 [Aegilops tauschii subsp. strangulata]